MARDAGPARAGTGDSQLFPFALQSCGCRPHATAWCRKRLGFFSTELASVRRRTAMAENCAQRTANASPLASLRHAHREASSPRRHEATKERVPGGPYLRVFVVKSCCSRSKRSGHAQPRPRGFSWQAWFITGFQQAGTGMAVHLDRQPGHPIGQWLRQQYNVAPCSPCSPRFLRAECQRNVGALSP
jgi:hypothetical protein